jgi:hypothetical protein
MFPNLSVTFISRVEVADDARTLNIWAVLPVTNELVGTAPAFSRFASYDIM